jgi:hypothetical protein
MTVWLDRVPLRDSSLAPEEILMSESQERMCAVVEPAKLDAFLDICAKWDVLATVIGEVDDSGRLTVQWHGDTIVDVPPRSVAHDGPVYQRPYARPSWQDALQAADRSRCRGRRPATSCARRCCRWWPRPTSRRSRGSPTSTTATSSATRCSPSRRTPASSGSTTRRISASRWPPTATAGSPSSTRTPVHSWPCPRRTATSRSAEPGRSRSPTA